MNETKFILICRELYTIGRRLNRDFSPTVQAMIDQQHAQDMNEPDAQYADQYRAELARIANVEFRTSSFS